MDVKIVRGFDTLTPIIFDWNSKDNKIIIFQ